MPIEATKPTVISATYPYWAVTFRTSGYPCAEPGGSAIGTVSAQVVMRRFRVRDDGIAELSPLDSDIVTFSIADIYARAAESPAVATALTAMLAAITAEASAQGVL